MPDAIKCNECDYYDSYLMVCRCFNIHDRVHPDSTCEYAKLKVKEVNNNE